MIEVKPLLALALFAASALAQSAVDGGKRPDHVAKSERGGTPAERAQRRAALRDALRPHQVQEPALLPVAAPGPVPRRLTLQERAELREQLRMQQSDNTGSSR
ncbi:hypothetical protein [Rhodoferax sp.]|uniref:hypothetical protein n=1 Tax=Rhodoferax sp. TaxID=50421 RepID=UPI00274987B5|nr:hypothetical protein [Rhodoferax sp.]